MHNFRYYIYHIKENYSNYGFEHDELLETYVNRKYCKYTHEPLTITRYKNFVLHIEKIFNDKRYELFFSIDINANSSTYLNVEVYNKFNVVYALTNFECSVDVPYDIISKIKCVYIMYAQQ